MKRARRLWLIAPWALFALIAAAWTGYWFVAAAKARDAIAAWAQSARAAGAEVSYGPLRAHGYPVLLRIDIADFAYAAPGGAWSASTSRIDAHLNLANPAQFGAAAPAPIVLERAGARTEIDAATLLVTARLRGQRLTRVSLEARELFIDDPERDGRLSFAGLLINARPDARAAGHWQVALEAADLHLARPARGFAALGQDIARLRTLCVVEAADALFAAAPGVQLDAWRDAGGRVRFEAFDIGWSAVNASGSGAAGLDQSRRLEGDLTLSLARPADALAALSRGADLDAPTKTALNAAGAGLSLLGERAPVVVRAADGVLSIENVRLRDLSPLY